MLHCEHRDRILERALLHLLVQEFDGRIDLFARFAEKPEHRRKTLDQSFHIVAGGGGADAVPKPLLSVC
jgi:hypothetical protein